ncbi:WGxxGxxG family protein [Streptomyces griseoloalbus]|uniref:WGxxGxxG family protein n=1 Tax=Streptomyces griseoloalbus TaxID=67303 RepID=A0ABV3DXG9_9ACTN
MRKLVGTVAIGILLAIAPAGAAFSQSAEQTTAQTTTATVVQAQEDEDDDGGNAGLWGLLGLLGLAGLIPRKSKRDQHRDQHGSSRM